jgi:hypothetical protein
VAIETRLQLARATQVAEWVQSLAGESLAKRAAEVADIESSSDIEAVPPLQPEPEDGPTITVAVPVAAPPVAVHAESTASRIGAVSRPLDRTPPEPRRRSRAVIAAGTLAVGAMVFLAWFAGTRHAVQPTQATTAAAAAVDLPPPPPSTEPSVVPAVPASSPPAPVASASALSTTDTAVPPHPRRPTRPKPAASSVPSLGEVLDTRR